MRSGKRAKVRVAFKQDLGGGVGRQRRADIPTQVTLCAEAWGVGRAGSSIWLPGTGAAQDGAHTVEGGVGEVS